MEKIISYNEVAAIQLPTNISQPELASAIKAAVTEWREIEDQVSIPATKDVPCWMSHELRIWSLGETLRDVMRAHRNWRGKGALLDMTANILQNDEFGKGRQTFALLLGDFGRGSYGDVLVEGLKDTDICGQCLSSLNKAKITGFEGAVRPLLQSNRAWIRDAARRYLANSEQLSDQK